MYDVQTWTLKQSNSSAFIRIKFLRVSYDKSHLVVVGDVMESEAKVDELGSP